MSQQFDTLLRPMTAAAAIPQFALVGVNSSGEATLNGLAGRAIGVAQREAFAAGDVIPVKLFYQTYKVLAKEALAAAATLYSEAGGKVQDTAEATALPVGIALEAATADGDVIEMVPLHYAGVAAS